MNVPSVWAFRLLNLRCRRKLRKTYFSRVRPTACLIKHKSYTGRWLLFAETNLQTMLCFSPLLRFKRSFRSICTATEAKQSAFSYIILMAYLFFLRKLWKISFFSPSAGAIKRVIITTEGANWNFSRTVASLEWKWDAFWAWAIQPRPPLNHNTPRIITQLLCF